MRQTVARPRAGWIDRLCRSLVHRALSHYRIGSLAICDESGQTQFGSSSVGTAAEIAVLNPRFYRRLVFGGSLGFAESWMAEEWVTPSLSDAIAFFARNLYEVRNSERLLGRAGRALARWTHNRAANTTQGSRRNIHAHYDLGNEFFELFLDDTMNYSCGLFENTESSLHDASIAKMDRLCRKLNLNASDHVVEIGTGWGDSRFMQRPDLVAA